MKSMEIGTHEADHPALEERVKQEAGTRAERVQRLTQQIETLFPGERLQSLRERITRSFEVPQCGEHHNEGMYMDTHLDLIGNNLENMRAGQFSAEMPEDVRSLLQTVATEHQETLARYAFLHDISKMDCLMIKYEDGKAITPTWEEWQTMLPDDLQKQPDPERFAAFAQAQKIKSIGYYWPEEMAKGVGGKKQVTREGKKHGQEGADLLRKLGDVGVAQAVLTAIEKHEVAFNFANASSETYQRHFGSLTDEERGLALVASYSDTVSSFAASGKPDLSNFLHVLDARHNYTLLQVINADIEIADMQKRGELDGEKVKSVMERIRKIADRVPETVQELIVRIKHECLPTQYDLGLLEQKLSALVAVGTLSEAQKNQMLDMVAAGQVRSISKELGKALGRQMQVVYEALQASEK